MAGRPHTELAVSSQVVAVTITSTHFAYPQRDDQAELAWVVWLNTKTVYPRTVTHLSINPARRRVTSLMCPTTLPLSQTATSTGATTLLPYKAYIATNAYNPGLWCYPHDE